MTSDPSTTVTAPRAVPAGRGRLSDARPVRTLDRDVAEARRSVEELRSDVAAHQERNERTVAGLHARIAEERRRADAGEGALGLLRTRATAAAEEVRACEERLAQQRTERERVVGEQSALLDAERTRAAALSDGFEDRLARLRTRLVVAERDVERERTARRRDRAVADSATDERRQAATTAAGHALERVKAELEARDQRIRDRAYQLAEDRERVAREIAACEAATMAGRARAAAAEGELKRAERTSFDAHAALAQLEARLERERDRTTGAVDRERTAAGALEQARAAQSAARQRADGLSARIREVERAREAATAAEREALGASERTRGALEVRERELAAARIEAGGASDALIKVQRELGAVHAAIAAAREELHEERVGVGTATALLDHERARNAAALQEAEARAHAALAAEQAARQRELVSERAAFDVARGVFEERLAEVRALADEQLVASRTAHQRERAQLERRVGALNGEIRTTIGTLRIELEAQRERTAALAAGAAADVAERDSATTAMEAELDASRRRATAIEQELTQREEIVGRVVAIARELRVGLDEVHEQIAAERAEHAETREKTRGVVAAAAGLLRRRRSGTPAVFDAETEAAILAADERTRAAG